MENAATGVIGEYCEVLRANNGPGFLHHPRGIQRQKSKCPTSQWGPGTDCETRLRICRQCQFYRVEEFKPARVGFIAAAYMSIGGTETWHQTLLPRLRGCTGFVCINPTLSQGDFSNLCVPWARGLDAAIDLAKAVEVLVVWGVGSDLSHILSQMSQRPKVISVSHCDRRSEWTTEIMRAQAPWTDHCVYICPTGLETVPHDLRDRSTCIPNGPDPARCVATRSRHLVRRDMEVPEDAKLLVVASRLSPEKQIQKLMQTVELMGDGWHLRIAGKSSGWSQSHRGELRRYESARVRIIELVKTPGDLLAAADASLSASDYEGYGLASAEAMLAGVPVISTLTGLLEYDLSLAAIVPHDASPKEWAAAIERDFENREAQSARTSRARCVMETEHSVERFVSSWDRLIESVRESSVPLPATACQAS